jgi:CRP-like cAMP-binding protein
MHPSVFPSEVLQYPRFIMTKSIFKTLNLTDSETAFIASKFKRFNVKKEEVLLLEDETVRHQYYVASGCMRTYFVDPDGKEHTVQFAVEDWWVSDYTAYFTEGKALMNIECIQDAVLYRISKESMEELYLAIPTFQQFFRRKLEKAFASFQKRILSNLSKSATERYLSFREDYPLIEQNVKNYHIASYLGMTTSSLSRVRRALRKP